MVPNPYQTRDVIQKLVHYICSLNASATDVLQLLTLFSKQDFAGPPRCKSSVHRSKPNLFPQEVVQYGRDENKDPVDPVDVEIVGILVEFPVYFSNLSTTIGATATVSND